MRARPALNLRGQPLARLRDGQRLEEGGGLRERARRRERRARVERAERGGHPFEPPRLERTVAPKLRALEPMHDADARGGVGVDDARADAALAGDAHAGEGPRRALQVGALEDVRGAVHGEADEHRPGQSA